MRNSECGINAVSLVGCAPGLEDGRARGLVGREEGWH
jgi:hypothetical protein